MRGGSLAQELVETRQTAFLAELITDLERLGYSTFPMDGEMSSNPIFSLDSKSGTAFLLHHVLGYKIEDAASLLEMSEMEVRTNLRSAYVQLASSEFGRDVYLSELPAESGVA